LFAHRQARHQAVAQEMTQAKELIGVAMGVNEVVLGPQDRMVVQQSIQHIHGFAQSAGNDLRMKHAVLVGDMRVY
jgi:hypothetical protein